MTPDRRLPLPEKTILVVEVGSTAHGTGLPGHEDHDEAAITVETSSEVFFRSRDTKMQRTAILDQRSKPDDTDRVIYSLRKFAALALAGNPSVLNVLWAPVLQIEPFGEELRSLAPLFVGRHVIPKYRGYMQSQVLKLKTKDHPVRGSARAKLIREQGFDTKFAMHAARLGFQGIELITTGKLTLPIEGATGNWLRQVRRGEIPLTAIYGMIEQLDADLAALADNEQYPAQPDRQKVEAFVMGAHMMSWGVPTTAFKMVDGEIKGRLR